MTTRYGDVDLAVALEAASERFVEIESRFDPQALGELERDVAHEAIRTFKTAGDVEVGVGAAFLAGLSLGIHLAETLPVAVKP